MGRLTFGNPGKDRLSDFLKGRAVVRYRFNPVAQFLGEHRTLEPSRFFFFEPVELSAFSAAIDLMLPLGDIRDPTIRSFTGPLWEFAWHL
jgi:hypothetical protein